MRVQRLDARPVTMDRPYGPAPIITYRNPREMIAASPGPQDHYQNHGVILLEDCGIDYDTDFVARLTFPPEWKKIGTRDDITVPPIVFKDGRFHKTQNPLCGIIENETMLIKVYSELLRLELGFKLLVHQLFTYRAIEHRNLTFRFTKTENEPVHLDYFDGGKAFPERLKVRRLKLFLNVDSQPRVWNVGPTLADLLLHANGAFGKTLPNDINVLTKLVYDSGLLAQVPMVRVEIPPRGIVFANGATVVHQVVSGNRMVALEAFVRDSPRVSEWDELPKWIEAAGYGAYDVAPEMMVGRTGIEPVAPAV